MHYKRYCHFEPPQCGEVAGLASERIVVRESVRPDETIWFTREKWQEFVDAIKSGEFDLEPCPEADREQQLEQVG